MEETVKKPHDDECLHILRISDTGVKEDDYVVITLVEAPYQPLNVNRVRMELINNESSYTHINHVRALVMKEMTWSKDFISAMKVRRLITPEQEEVYFTEWVFADSYEAFERYLERLDEQDEE
jgi:hypothetical protein